MKKRFLAIILLISLTALYGCNKLPEEDAIQPEIVLVGEEIPPAPYGDSQISRDFSATLYYTSSDGYTLVPIIKNIALHSNITHTEAIMRTLLEEPMDTALLPVARNVTLNPDRVSLEVTQGLAVVDLSAEAQALTPKELFNARKAITATLCSLPEINNAIILVDGMEYGYDAQGSLPTGIISGDVTGSLMSQWNDLNTNEIERLTSNAISIKRNVALYYPYINYDYILPEIREITFESINPVDMAKDLINELSVSPATINAREYDVLDLLQKEPSQVIDGDGSDFMLTFNFKEELREYLASRHIDESMFIASLTYTLTTFIPRLKGIYILIGDEYVQSVTLNTHDINGEGSIVKQLDDGFISRDIFNDVLGCMVTVYMPDAARGLKASPRPVAQYNANNPRILLLELAKPAKSGTALIYSGFSNNEILGVQIWSDVICVNLAQTFLDNCSDFTPEQERNLIYSIVNTLTELPGLERVCLYIDGRQEACRASDIVLQGYFFRHPGLIVQ